ncbi:MAG: DUF58 domain-containing protein [Saprospiraceae bacterium]
MKSLYLTNRFFLLFGCIVVLFILAFPFAFFLPVAQTVLVLSIALVVVDYLRLFNKNVSVSANRSLPKLLSLSDANPIKVLIKNESSLSLNLTIIDEIPFQFQQRNFSTQLSLTAEQEETIRYFLTPLERGEYEFGKINLYLSTSWQLVERRISADASTVIPVYPSIIQMKNLALRAFDKISYSTGIKKLRRIGHSYEFEQIKNYVRGDDYRSINWKATGRQGKLMVNQFQDERSQRVYCLIDKSRSMRMPFAGLSLMDYAINTSLVISNIALQKYDRAGLLTFSDKMGTTLKADNQPAQLNKIIEALYKEKERTTEANYELLYQAVRRLISGRSLLLLFTNFESNYALERVLPILRRINIRHLLVVVFFENTEVSDFIDEEVKTIADIYDQTTARQFVVEKQQMVQKLRQYGIQAVLTRPEDLSVNTINKYLELKARGLI